MPRVAIEHTCHNCKRKWMTRSAPECILCNFHFCYNCFNGATKMCAPHDQFSDAADKARLKTLTTTFSWLCCWGLVILFICGGIGALAMGPGTGAFVGYAIGFGILIAIGLFLSRVIGRQKQMMFGKIKNRQAAQQAPPGETVAPQ